MAKIYGTYSCGCEGCVNITGSMKDREWKAKKFFEHMCPKCRQKKIQKNNMDSCVFSCEMNLPALEGSEKQEAWAETIRMNIFNDILSRTRYKLYVVETNTIELIASDLSNILSFLSKETSAKIWIENRTTDGMIKYALKYMRKEN